MDCPSCKEKGKLETRICPACKGTGVVVAKSKVEKGRDNASEKLGELEEIKEVGYNKKKRKRQRDDD